MNDEHTVDSTEAPDSAGPRQESDATTESDAGMTGDEGTQPAQPAAARDEDGD